MMRMWKLNNDGMKTMTLEEQRKRFARLVYRIMREERITEKELARRLSSWHPDRVRELLKGEIPLDRRIKVQVAQALGLKPESRQPGVSAGTTFEALTDKELDSLFEIDLPDSYKY